MAALPPAIEKDIKKFLDEVSKDFPIEAAYVFGSTARGEASPFSDVDVAVVSRAFRGMRRVDVIAELLSRARGAEIDLQPIGFTPEDFEDETDDFARTIESEGVPLATPAG